MMRQLALILIAVVSGYCLTLIFYFLGGPFVMPAVFLARIFVPDRGGESLLVPFAIINTALCAVLIYGVLWWATGRARASQ